MTSLLNEQELLELRQSSSHREVSHNTNGFDYTERIEFQFAKEHYQLAHLRPGLCLEIIDDHYYKDFSLQPDHSEFNCLVAKFYISGRYKVLTPNVPNIPEEYIEQAGYNYLLFLPDIQETELYFANQHCQMIRIEIDPKLLATHTLENSRLPWTLQQLLKGNLEHCFHQTLGRTTAAMELTLRQLLNCPYQGMTKRIYLESKILELLALQIHQWTEHNTEHSSYSCRSLHPGDIERLHHAKEILLQNFDNPPSLLDLARQVGLNDYKLKQGFRQVFGTTVFGYLQMHRMKYAQQLLTQRELSVAGVAQLVGYASQSRFCDAFKRQFGVSPREYRTRLRG
ncbi:helix-turn-helix transcriptional regulator [Leptolyngbya sp. NK1-12]|uniref:Helix-turn-helix transcriptional regulator n=1 Tax=Leptolyngbya sp. NK1-12 TaxID=2547451 RepID=A0AA97AGB2_9CYAN|nr:AraC family transcriptional regulator [Leptolyngbya sp. NK1-12]WNZ21631.1 helix-turn-helix transcriptional regulator [Leptolyngbya sp. NK1-12]